MRTRLVNFRASMRWPIHARCRTCSGLTAPVPLAHLLPIIVKTLPQPYFAYADFYFITSILPVWFCTDRNTTLPLLGESLFWLIGLIACTYCRSERILNTRNTLPIQSSPFRLVGHRTTGVCASPRHIITVKGNDRAVFIWIH